jgi:hypothetical protein
LVAQGDEAVSQKLAVVVDRLPVLVYLLICAVGFGYWIVEPHTRASSASLAAPSASADSSLRRVAAISVSAPELHARLKPLLSRGTDLAVAAAEFEDPTEFAAVAHAAHNTQIPFMLLKHRIVHQGMTLADAIRASRPDADAAAEADFAAAEAHADLAALSR